MVTKRRVWFEAKPKLRVGPKWFQAVLNFSGFRFSSLTIRSGRRASWNNRTKIASINTPGLGSVKFRTGEPKPPVRRRRTP